jgi:hypothetical protein
MDPAAFLTGLDRVISVSHMDAVQCTHCKVTMTSWASPGSPIRYYQCPFCARIHTSCYGETFQRGGGARAMAAPAQAAQPSSLPQASCQEIQWAGVKARAARWFARLEAEELHASARLARALPPRQAAPRPGPSTVAVAAVGARPARHK